MNKGIIYARVAPYICMVFMMGATIFYVGHAIQQNNKVMCRLTVKIEDNGVNSAIKNEVRDINREYHCRRLVKP